MIDKRKALERDATMIVEKAEKALYEQRGLSRPGRGLHDKRAWRVECRSSLRTVRHGSFHLLVFHLIDSSFSRSLIVSAVLRDCVKDEIAKFEIGIKGVTKEITKLSRNCVSTSEPVDVNAEVSEVQEWVIMHNHQHNNL